MKLPTIGIIGNGHFGAFLAEKLGEQLNVEVYAHGDSAEILKRVAGRDYVILAVPLGVYDEVLQQLKPVLPSTSVIVDVCSVKQRPVEIIKQHLPEQPLVATHPLFGPDSAADGLAGHTIVMCPEVSDPVHYQRLSALGQMMGMSVLRMSAEAHDKDIAVVQGLTMFVGRAVLRYGIDEQILSTPYSAKLRALADVERNHSDELYATIQSGNVHTAAVRTELIEIMRQLDSESSTAEDPVKE